MVFGALEEDMLLQNIRAVTDILRASPTQGQEM